MMEYLNAFLCGGLLCAVGQIILDKTALTPGRILTGYVVMGVLLQAVGVYQYIADWGGAGATVPLTGFGNLPLCELVRPRLTTVEQSPFDTGVAAARLLLERISSTGNTGRRDVIIPTRVIPRNSTR